MQQYFILSIESQFWLQMDGVMCSGTMYDGQIVRLTMREEKFVFGAIYEEILGYF